MVNKPGLQKLQRRPVHCFLHIFYAKFKCFFYLQNGLHNFNSEIRQIRNTFILKLTTSVTDLLNLMIETGLQKRGNRKNQVPRQINICVDIMVLNKVSKWWALDPPF